jgi:hypothetical protein
MRSTGSLGNRGTIQGIPIEKRTSFYKALGKTAEQIFPMLIKADPGLTTGVQVAKVHGFYKKSGDNADVER